MKSPLNNLKEAWSICPVDLSIQKLKVLAIQFLFWILGGKVRKEKKKVFWVLRTRIAWGIAGKYSSELGCDVHKRFVEELEVMMAPKEQSLSTFLDLRHPLLNLRHPQKCELLDFLHFD